MHQLSNRNHVMLEHSQPCALVSRHEYNQLAISGKITRNGINDCRSWNHGYLDHETVAPTIRFLSLQFNIV